MNTKLPPPCLSVKAGLAGSNSMLMPAGSNLNTSLLTGSSVKAGWPLACDLSVVPSLVKVISSGTCGLA